MNEPREASEDVKRRWSGLVAEMTEQDPRKQRAMAVKRAMKMRIFGPRGELAPSEPHGKRATKPKKRRRGRLIFYPLHGSPKAKKRARRPEKRLVGGKWVLFAWSEAKEAFVATRPKDAWENSIQCPMVGDRRHR